MTDPSESGSEKQQPELPDKENPFGWRRAAELVKNIFRLERSMIRLEQENRERRKRVEELQRSVDDHNGHLKAILATMNTTLKLQWNPPQSESQ